MIFIKNTRKTYTPSGRPIYKALYECPICHEQIEYSKANLKHKPDSHPCLNCNNKKGNYKHGLRTNPNYTRWKGINSRCYYKSSTSYSNYGARGIKVCDEWRHDAKAFIDYIESLPNANIEGLSIDRINNNGNYEPGNIKWSTRSEQINNSRVGRPGIISYIGVGFDKKRKDDKHFTSSIRVNKKPIYLGHYNTAKEAAIVRNDYIDNNNLIHRRNKIES